MRIVIVWLAAAALALGTLAAEPPVSHVLNTSTPTDGHEVWRCREIWRVGGDNESDPLFGLISEIGADEAGNIYVLDTQLCHVHMFSPQGDLVRTLFRPGEGPAEIDAPIDLVVLPDAVGLAQEYPGKIVIVDRDGNPRPTIVPGQGSSVSLTTAGHADSCILATGAYIGQGDEPGTQSRTYFLASFDPEGAERTRFLEAHGVYNYTDFTFSERHHIPSFWWGWTTTADGHLYVVPDRDQYMVHVYDSEGVLERVIQRAHAPARRDEAAIGRLHRLLEGAMAGLPFEVAYDIEPTHPAISSFHRPLHVTPDGYLWVTTTEGLLDQPDGIMATYDVFDPAGTFVKQVSIACEGRGYDDCLFFIGHDRIVLLKGYIDALAAQFGRGVVPAGEDEDPQPPEVICYEVVSQTRL